MLSHNTMTHTDMIVPHTHDVTHTAHADVI